MLGATGNEASWPGFLPGPGHYGEERRIFGGFGLQRREFPLDMAFVLGSMLLTLFTIGNQVEVYEKLTTYYRSVEVPGFDGVPEIMRFEAVGICAVLTAALVIAWLRRNRLGRI
jgi:hypothetical protein